MARPKPDVTLAPLTPEDAPRIYGWILDPEVSRNIGLRKTPSLERTHEWIREVSNGRAKAFGIYLSGTHVGNVVLDCWDDDLQSARLSIYIGEAGARRQGAGSAAVQQALERGFGRLGLKKIWLTVHADHRSAIRVYERAGFKKEGVHRREFLLDGRRTDALYMGILAEEFHDGL